MSKIKTDTLLTPADVARELGVSPITVRSWVTKGWLQSRVTPGGHRRFLRQDVDRLLTERIRPDRRHNALKVLVVDDDPQFRAFLTEVMATLHGIGEVRSATDGFHAGMALAEFRPDIVMLDYAMPGMNGAEVCRLIKGNPLHRRLRVVAVTGFAEPSIMAALRQAGADHILTKPVSLREIEDILACFEPGSPQEA